MMCMRDVKEEHSDDVRVSRRLSRTVRSHSYRYRPGSVLSLLFTTNRSGMSLWNTYATPTGMVSTPTDSGASGPSASPCAVCKPHMGVWVVRRAERCRGGLCDV